MTLSEGEIALLAAIGGAVLVMGGVLCLAVIVARVSGWVGKRTGRCGAPGPWGTCTLRRGHDGEYHECPNPVPVEWNLHGMAIMTAHAPDRDWLPKYYEWVRERGLS